MRYIGPLAVLAMIVPSHATLTLSRRDKSLLLPRDILLTILPCFFCSCRLPLHSTPHPLGHSRDVACKCLFDFPSLPSWSPFSSSSSSTEPPYPFAHRQIATHANTISRQSIKNLLFKCLPRRAVCAWSFALGQSRRCKNSKCVGGGTTMERG